MVQMAIYASEMLAVEGLIRNHALGMLTQDDWTWLWYFDSAGAVQAQGFNILAHTADFVLILMLLQRFKLPQWGFPEGTNSEARLDVIRCLSPPRAEIPGPAGGTRDPARQPVETFEVVGTGKDDLPKTMVVDPERILHKPSPILRGRRTMVLEAQDPGMPTMSYVAKWSYPETIRCNEAKAIWIAREIVEDMDKEALGSLTDVVAFKDFAHLSTDNIRRHLRLFSDPTQSLVDAEYHGERILRCIFEVKLKPLTYLTGFEFVRGIIDCINCHKLLWIGNGKHRIEHTDLSFWNLGVCPFSLRVRVRDLDLARVVIVGQPSQPQGSERTGTIPFMALDLLDDAYWKGDLERLYRHDLEAFVWVTVYYAWAFNDEGVEDEASPVQAWLTNDYDLCRLKKVTFLARQAIHELPDYKTSQGKDSTFGIVLSFARRLSRWLNIERSLQSATNPHWPDPFDESADDEGVENEPLFSDGKHGDKLQDAVRVFEHLWDHLKGFRSVVKGVEVTPERVEYYMEREKKIEKLKAQRRAEDDRLDREADDEERERKKAKKAEEEEAREECDRLVDLYSPLLSYDRTWLHTYILDDFLH
ncbi:uncharacterized protein B0H18DRAFT_902748 [Fomitopsis serialis]|uniref:uncharacterized protein n=1 Tax=Fomitopsis serialis TaxID=139415 RepID=UPI002008CB5A|nr:uncharacterized protein B0H18DRAFT_902748 [Neoantrodia serialis]KAH9934139.1 hypothetical protein B0H18DRAFT_902748 [Neoantrodia serialis]